MNKSVLSALLLIVLPGAAFSQDVVSGVNGGALPAAAAEAAPEARPAVRPGFNPFMPASAAPAPVTPGPAAIAQVEAPPPPPDPRVAAEQERIRRLREDGRRVGTVDGKVILRHGDQHLIERKDAPLDSPLKLCNSDTGANEAPCTIQIIQAKPSFTAPMPANAK